MEGGLAAVWLANNFNDLTLPSLVAQEKGGCGVIAPTGFGELLPGEAGGYLLPSLAPAGTEGRVRPPSRAPRQAAPFSGNPSPTPSFCFHSLGLLVRQVGHRDG